jgi:hypothetical protein
MSDSITNELLSFAIDQNIAIEFFGDKYGKNVRARFDQDGVEHGHVIAIGSRRRGGGRHTAETAIAEHLLYLSSKNRKIGS